jgi:hypothetical protein
VGANALHNFGRSLGKGPLTLMTYFVELGN